MKGYPITPAQKQYIRDNIDEFPSVIAYRASILFSNTITARGVRNMIKHIKTEA
jgi:hypothetical protein